ncbi:MAG: hypothetical protein LBK53_07060 [Heliobacteriaceae bacterium]|jgi:hypothetical protein|nr:hypothetical protein [Heliobacteriaceae bacterium]
MSDELRIEKISGTESIDTAYTVSENTSCAASVFPGKAKPDDKNSQVIQTEDGSIIRYADSELKIPQEMITNKEGRIIRTIFENGKKKSVTITQDSAFASLQYDKQGDLICYAETGENFIQTASRLGLKQGTAAYNKFAEKNRTAFRNGYFGNTERVKIPSGFEQNLNLQAFDNSRVAAQFDPEGYTKYPPDEYVVRLNSEGAFTVYKKDEVPQDAPELEFILRSAYKGYTLNYLKLYNKKENSDYYLFYEQYDNGILKKIRLSPDFLSDNPRGGIHIEQEYSPDGKTPSKHDKALSLSDNLAYDIYKKNGGIYIRGEDFLENIKLINSENIHSVLDSYASKTKRRLVDDIAAALGETESKPILEHLETIRYKTKFHNPNSQINNDYYKGDVYDVEADGDIITVKSAQREFVLNLEEVLSNKISCENRMNLKDIIRNLPGEVLEDLYIELKRVNHTPQSVLNAGCAGIFLPWNNKLFTDAKTGNLVHELGHALDFHNNYKCSYTNKELKAVYKKELAAYKTAGHARYTDDVSNYATKNIFEMVAESYALMMTGDCYSKECIETHFKETFRLVKEHIADIRKLPDRHRKKTIF